VNGEPNELLAALIGDSVERFGPRFRETWIIARVEIEGDAYPETFVDTEAGIIQVRITNSAGRDAQKATYQLAHEAIHCIAATGRRDTIYFEEGLANYNALTSRYLDRNYRRRARRTLPGVLRVPLAAFEALKPTDEAIRALRLEQPDFDRLQPHLIERILGVGPDIAASVCQRMPFDRPIAM
jgi:hypothetical protein